MLMYAMLGLVNGKMSKRVDQKVLKWFGHVERMGDERLTIRNMSMRWME